MTALLARITSLVHQLQSFNMDSITLPEFTVNYNASMWDPLIEKFTKTSADPTATLQQSVIFIFLLNNLWVIISIQNSPLLILCLRRVLHNTLASLTAADNQTRAMLYYLDSFSQVMERMLSFTGRSQRHQLNFACFSLLNVPFMHTDIGSQFSQYPHLSRYMELLNMQQNITEVFLWTSMDSVKVHLDKIVHNYILMSTMSPKVFAYSNFR